jgi:hypothetical protein
MLHPEITPVRISIPKVAVSLGLLITRMNDSSCDGSSASIMSFYGRATTGLLPGAAP